MASKEEQILELFLNEPTKYWHFTKIVETVQITKTAANRWLKKLQEDRTIKRIKPKGKMPYFQANWDHDNYKNRKKLYALQKLYASGLIPKLQSLKNTLTIIIFGSYVRSDWITDSDVDVFIYGNCDDMPFDTVWEGLGFQGKSRAVQVHTFHTRKEMEEVKSGLLKNVLRGYVVKGDIYEVMEVAAS